PIVLPGDHPHLVRAGGRAFLVYLHGTQLLGWDFQTGKPAWADHELGLPLWGDPVFADLDGDGRPEILVVEGRRWLTALRLPPDPPLWQVHLSLDEKAQSNSFPGVYSPLRSWPLVGDLGDGKPQIILPAYQQDSEDTTLWVGVEVRDGAAGQRRWLRKLRYRE